MTYPGRGPKLKPEDRDRQIVEAWRDRPQHRRSAEDVSLFYAWLLEHKPDLVPQGPGSFRHVQQALEPHLSQPKS